jgi:hypothetical protein
MKELLKEMMRVMIILVIFLILLTAIFGCATVEPPLVVKIPVVVSCVKDVPEKPEYETAKLSRKSPAGEKVVKLSRDWSLSRIYEGELEAVIEGCR